MPSRRRISRRPRESRSNQSSIAAVLVCQRVESQREDDAARLVPSSSPRTSGNRTPPSGLDRRACPTETMRRSPSVGLGSDRLPRPTRAGRRRGRIRSRRGSAPVRPGPRPRPGSRLSSRIVRRGRVRIVVEAHGLERGLETLDLGRGVGPHHLRARAGPRTPVEAADVSGTEEPWAASAATCASISLADAPRRARTTCFEIVVSVGQDAVARGGDRLEDGGLLESDADGGDPRSRRGRQCPACCTGGRPGSASRLPAIGGQGLASAPGSRGRCRPIFSGEAVEDRARCRPPRRAAACGSSPAPAAHRGRRSARSGCPRPPSSPSRDRERLVVSRSGPGGSARARSSPAQIGPELRVDRLAGSWSACPRPRCPRAGFARSPRTSSDLSLLREDAARLGADVARRRPCSSSALRRSLSCR